jgi:integrase
MKGRAPAKEEFERMLKAAPKVVGTGMASGWRHFLRGLWRSGLRLNEAMTLHWTDDSGMAVDFSHKRPMFRIQAASEKGREFRLLPMTPDFYRFLMKTPEEERRGFVFKPRCPETGERPGRDHASRLITRIGKAAKVKVSERTVKKRRKIKWASAHDLRRAFGVRWSNRVRAPLLMLLMRHKSINTTLTFYVGQDANAAADEVWRSRANGFANRRHSDASQKDDEES